VLRWLGVPTPKVERSRELKLYHSSQALICLAPKARH
jgi:hypothetical protein